MTTSRAASRVWRHAAILAIFLALAAINTHSVLRLSGSHIANDPYDPILNTSILWWNAITVPFSAEWWNPPYFYPAEGVSAFTENLVGISVISSPVFWLTRNPLAAYNIAYFLTWPLSAFGTYLLTFFLVRRHDAAFIAGLVYGFTPYRTSEMGHIQMLSSYWLPVSFLGLHGFLEQRRSRWLVLFGVAWILQSLSNGYFMLFGAVLIGLWLAYFCTTRNTWRAAPAIVVTLGVASLPLVPVMWKYHTVHEYHGLRRIMSEIVWFSAPPAGWFETSPHAWLWSRVLPWGKDNLFPGVTAVALVLIALAVLMWRRAPVPQQESPVRRRVRLVMGAAAGLSIVAVLSLLALGPWRFTLAGVVVRMADPYRALTLLALCGVPYLLWTERTRRALQERSLFVFYTAAALVMVVLCFGPVLRVGDAVIMDPAPYRWLMYLPGFDQLRVPTRFAMPGMMCLAVAAAVAFLRIAPSRPWLRRAAFAITLAGLGLDGYLHPVHMADPPAYWPRVERRDQAQPILELPLGPEWDAAATFRSIWHRRRVLNGVSGYDPTHYVPLMHGLNSHDPEIILAIASLGSFDIVITAEHDRDGRWTRYVTGVPGVRLLSTDGARTAYRVPTQPSWEVALGEVLPVAGITASGQDASVAIDGKLETEWHDGPQRPGEWLVLDIGEVREVGGVTEALGEYARDYSRRQAIDVSLDGTTWEQVWEGPTAARAFLAAVNGPRETAVRIAFPPRSARFVRLRQLARDIHLWRVAELRAHAPVNSQ